MSGFNYIVPPLSWSDISRKADQVREAFQRDQTPSLAIIDLLETLPYVLENFDFHVLPDEEMPGLMGSTAADGTSITLAESVHRRASNNSGRDRFTAAHELGHLVLHTGFTGPSFPRAQDPNAIKPYRLSEPQADAFAGMILMPKKFIMPNHTASDLVTLFGVSQSAANRRLITIARQGV